MQFKLISAFLQKNIDCFFCLQSNWWPHIDHRLFLYLTTFFRLFIFQTSACFTDGHKILFVPFHTRKIQALGGRSDPSHCQNQWSQYHVTRWLAEPGRHQSQLTSHCPGWVAKLPDSPFALSQPPVPQKSILSCTMDLKRLITKVFS